MKKALLLGLVLFGATAASAGEVQQDESYIQSQSIPTPEGSYLDFSKGYSYYAGTDGNKVVDGTALGNMRPGSYVVLQLDNTLSSKGYLLSFQGGNKNEGGRLSIDIYSSNPISDTEATPIYSTYVDIAAKGNWNDKDTYSVGIPASIPTGDLYMKLTAARQSGSSVAFTGNFDQFTMTENNNALLPDMTFDINSYKSTSGTITIENGEIKSTKNKASVIYMFSVTESGNYAVVANWASKYDTTIKMNISTSPDTFDDATEISVDLTATGAWDTFINAKWESFELTTGTTYYLKITYITSSGWAGNTNYLALERMWSIVNDNTNLGVNEIYKNGDQYTADRIELNDNIDFSLPIAVTADVATYTRTVSADTWNALYLPFAVGNAADFASNVVKFKNVESVGTNTYLVFEKVEGSDLEANTIYLFQPKDGVTEITAEGNNVVVSSPAGATTQSGTNGADTYTLTGTYAKMTGLQSMNAYALSGDAFKKADSDNVELNPYRAYLTVASADPQSVPARIGIKTDNETTSISDIIIENAPNANVYYNLQGIRVDNPTTGLYIKNGKKIYVK